MVHAFTKLRSFELVIYDDGKNGASLSIPRPMQGLTNLERKNLLTVRSERVKCVDFHPSDPWVLAGLYSGNVTIWDYNTGRNVRTVSASSSPVRCARFIARLNWIIVGSDDFSIRIFNAISGDRLACFDAHADYIRCLAVHPTRPLVLSCSDDTTIKLWDWEKDWKCVGVFEGHIHYVMGIAFNPRDGNTFASASLDRTVKVWSINGGGKPNYTLEGHRKGLNAISYYPGDKPYLATAADDRTVRIWDYQGRSCVKILEGHTANVSCLGWGGATLPLLFSGSEDGTLRIWNATTLKCENTLKVGLDRIWTLSVRGNEVVLGCDEGTTVLRLGRSEPVACMRGSKILWIQSPSPMVMSANADDFPSSSSKELGTSEISMVNQIGISASGRLLSIVGNEGDFVIYSTLAMRNKAFGKALEIAWGDNSSGIGDVYATRDPSGTRVTVFSGSNFSEISALTFPNSISVDRIFGGRLLGLYHGSQSLLSFYDWSSAALVRSMEISVEKVAWSFDGGFVALVGSDSCLYILSFNEGYANVPGNYSEEEGYELAFKVVAQFPHENPKSLCWTIDELLVYVQASRNHLKFWTPKAPSACGDLALSCSERQFMIGSQNVGSNLTALYFIEQENFNIDASKKFDKRIVEFSIALAADDKSTIMKLAPLDNELPGCRQQAITHFEKTGQYDAAMHLAVDQPETSFRLALAAGMLSKAFEFLDGTQGLSGKTDLWQRLGLAALQNWQTELAEQCFSRSRDIGMLSLLQVLSGKTVGLSKDEDKLPANLQFTRAFLSGCPDRCLSIIQRSGSSTEAALFSRAYGLKDKDECTKTWSLTNSIIDPAFAVEASNRTRKSAGMQSVKNEEYLSRDSDMNFIPSQGTMSTGNITNATSANSELDMLSVEVQTTGTGSLKGDDIEPIMGPGGPSANEVEPIPEEMINGDDNLYDEVSFSKNEDSLGQECEDDFVDSLEDPWKTYK